MSSSGSPPLTKWVEMAASESFSDTVRPEATSDCAINCPPKVRGGLMVGCPPTNTSVSGFFSSSSARSCSKSGALLMLSS
ncbi:Uncharacterised protein [Mycobacteroides abscessus subsp. abscessus]|nr:Uncharacterised protein [Mycobacteroides abscessus subsp. abscessus]